MSSAKEKLARLRAYNATLRGEDETPTEEEFLEVALPLDRATYNESIILRKRRPVFVIQDGATTLDFKDAVDGALWRSALEQAHSVLEPAIRAVGRIDLEGHPDYGWVGTGWLVHDHVLVTNRHVAETFAARSDEGFVFQAGPDGDVAAAIDFLHELSRPAARVFKVNRVLYIEPSPGLDLAFLEVDATGGALASPLVLSGKPLGPNPAVATIGYPAYDSRIPEPELMREIYGDAFDTKRLAPGAITAIDETRVHHNCTTLGGNSGSAVIDLKTGEALGLHFSGSFMRTNFAVRADRVEGRLHELLSGKLPAPRERGRATPPRPLSAPAFSGPPRPSAVTRQPTFNITIPLVVTVSLGQTGRSEPVRPGARARVRVENADEDTETEASAKPEDYANRTGYRADFLGDAEVALPHVVKNVAHVLTFGGGEHVLRYEHFSVVMNRRRRMCCFSACNIDGARSKSSKRSAWRFDPRIPTELQIMKECYGNAPRFSRGHMTRREDPAWGKTASIIQRGADDSMHVTNVTPQMQTFNSPIWLALEDYALQHAREDDMKISVFTGPYFAADDPTMFGVRIPTSFWKVIAFIHEKTGELCATGYEMSQEGNLEEPEFVFGDFHSPQLNVSTQVSIGTIESRAGITFGTLADFDPLGAEGPEGAPDGQLRRFEQIRFL